MASVPRVVLSGFGVATPLGIGKEALWDALVAGKSGIVPIKAFDASSLPCRIAGEIRDLDPKNFIEKKERKSLRVMARAIQLAVVAAQICMDDTRLKKGETDPTRFGIEFGSGLIPSELHELGMAAVISCKNGAHDVDLKIWGEQGIPNITPLWMLKYLPNMLACHVSILQDAQGPNNTITESEVAGLLALGEAYRILRRGQADIFLVGGADSKINPLSMVRQAKFAILSKRNETPETAVRPYDLTRDGYVLGEGGGVVVAEVLEHAQKRNAPILAEMVGFGASFDRGCTGRGLARAIRFAMEQANVKPSDIDHVNGVGLGSPVSDAWEAKGIHEVFGLETPVWGLKSSTGNLGASSTLVELTASVMALHKGILPATRNYFTPDPECPIQVTREPRPVTKPYFVKIGFTDMGQCSAIVCRKWE